MPHYHCTRLGKYPGVALNNIGGVISVVGSGLHTPPHTCSVDYYLVVHSIVGIVWCRFFCNETESCIYTNI